MSVNTLGEKLPAQQPVKQRPYLRHTTNPRRIPPDGLFPAVGVPQAASFCAWCPGEHPHPILPEAKLPCQDARALTDSHGPPQPPSHPCPSCTELPWAVGGCLSARPWSLFILQAAERVTDFKFQIKLWRCSNTVGIPFYSTNYLNLSAAVMCLSRSQTNIFKTRNVHPCGQNS